MSQFATVNLGRHLRDSIEAGLAEQDKMLPTGGFKSFGHLAWCVARRGRDGQPGVDRAVLACKAWDTLLRKTPSGNFEESDPDGGLLVPIQYSRDLWQRTYDQNQILAYLDPIPIAGRQISIPALKEDSRADASRHGSVLGYWTSEADQYTKTSPKFRRIEMQLNKLIVAVYATEEMIEDTPALESYLSPLAAAEINFKVNDAVVNGSGVGMPLGLLHANSKITQAALSGQGATTIVGINVLNMNARITPALRADSIWLYNEDAESSLLRMFVATGQYSAAGLVSYRSDGQLLLCGRPALLIEQCATLGTEGDLIAFAPRGYAAIIKRGIENAVSMHLRFDYDESMYKFRLRMDGQPKDDVALTPYKGTATTSAVVTLSSTRT